MLQVCACQQKKNSYSHSGYSDNVMKKYVIRCYSNIKINEWSSQECMCHECCDLLPLTWEGAGECRNSMTHWHFASPPPSLTTLSMRVQCWADDDDGRVIHMGLCAVLICTYDTVRDDHCLLIVMLFTHVHLYLELCAVTKMLPFSRRCYRRTPRHWFMGKKRTW